MKDVSQKYHHTDTESRWKDAWNRVHVYTFDLKTAHKPFYNLMMFPYPSAEGLHVGNMYAFTGSDLYGRFKRMQGYDVFEPIGLDGFGIHSENYALKIGRHPMDHAQITQNNFYNQLHNIGSMYDWSRTLETYDPEYYRWTQWLFIQMFKHGLAYRAKASVNWCPSCKTVLADEQVIKKTGGSTDAQSVKETDSIPEDVQVCERCGNIVEKKLMEQWFFRITAYAEKLLSNLRTLDWSEKVKKAQDSWIGKKAGIEINYRVLSGDNKVIGQVTCYTTRPDTNYGATFVVLAPEHEFITHILRVISKERASEIGQYLKQVKKLHAKSGAVAEKKKTGVFTGLYCINGLNNYKMPLYISDFVLEEVGTGAVVGVPGHDKRDYGFAMAFKLPIKRVVVASDGEKGPITDIDHVQEEEGTMIDSDFLNGQDILTAKNTMMEYLVKKGWGKKVITYHLRDWLISRQRYWGPPIPMVFCKKCADLGASWWTTDEAKSFMKNTKSQISMTKQKENKTKNLGFVNWNLEFPAGMAGWYPVEEKSLPVVLPRIEDYRPGNDGIAPLAKHKEFYETTCPGCKSNAVRETDVSDTFLDSSWYFLRYPSVLQKNTADAKSLNDKNFKNGSEATIGKDLADDTQRVLSLPIDKYQNRGNRKNSKKTKKSSSDNIKNDQFPWNPEITKRWLPVHMYTGGAEHSVLHLMYSRFVTMALHDFGYINFEEPFTRFYAHGLVIKDGAKMSKSKGNVVAPDEYIVRYGADALRLYLMFMGPFSQGGDFRDSAMEGMARWIGRVWRMAIAAIDQPSAHRQEDIVYALQKLVGKVTDDLEKRRYNTAIAAMMEFTNLVSAGAHTLDTESLQTLILLLAPFAPHITEEIWQRIHKVADHTFVRENSVHVCVWPKEISLVVRRELVDVIVQVGGKVRDVLSVGSDVAKNQKEIEILVEQNSKVQKYLKTPIKKIIFVTGKLINFVV